MRYSNPVLQYFYERKNFGELAALPGEQLGEGFAGNERVSMRIMIRVEEGRISAARYQCPTCVVAVAAGSLVTVLVEGMSLDEAACLPAEVLLEKLGGIPPERQDRCEIAVTALKNAVEDYQTKTKMGEMFL